MRLREKTVILLTLAALVAGGCGPRFKEAKGGTGQGAQVAAGGAGAETTVVGVDSDRLYPIRLQHEMAALLPGRPEVRLVTSPYGHDAFLVESIQVAKHVAATVRGPAVRAFAFELGGMFQVSMNLLDWQVVGPANAYDAVVRAADHAGADVFGAELVGLLPELALEAVPKSRWAELGLEGSKTIEARLRVARAR